MTMITPSYLGETIEYSSLHACRSTLEDPTGYPFVPAIFVLCAAAVLVFSFAGNLKGSLLGTAIILAGLPVLVLVRKQRALS